MDKLTASIDEYAKMLASIGECASEAVKEEINQDADEFEKTVRKKAEKVSKRLSQNFERVPTKKNERYGFTFRFVGDIEQPKKHRKAERSPKTITTHQGLASLLDSGDKKHKATKFVTSAVRKLKGLDNKIIAKYEKKLKEKGLL